jgi:hypothetical protein
MAGGGCLCPQKEAYENLSIIRTVLLLAAAGISNAWHKVHPRNTRWGEAIGRQGAHVWLDRTEHPGINPL